MLLKSHKKRQYEDPIELRFNAMMELIKDLSKADYNRLKKAMDLGWQSYQTVRNVRTDDEKEIEDIGKAEKILEVENGRD